MQHALSVLLPVRDAQSTLIDSVHEVLDVMADTNESFELLIIDDGSADATSEVADELSRSYPQVRFVRHGIARGQEEAIRTGLHASRGDVVVLRDEAGEFRLIRRHWPMPATAASRPQKPNYLRRITEFAVGE